jgi:hypothetical protein
MTDSVEYFLRLLEGDINNNKCEKINVEKPLNLTTNTNIEINTYNNNYSQMCKQSLLSEYIYSIDYFIANNFNEGTVLTRNKEFNYLPSKYPEMYENIENLILFSDNNLMLNSHYTPVEKTYNNKLYDQGYKIYKLILDMNIKSIPKIFTDKLGIEYRQSNYKSVQPITYTPPPSPITYTPPPSPITYTPPPISTPLPIKSTPPPPSPITYTPPPIYTPLPIKSTPLPIKSTPPLPSPITYTPPPIKSTPSPPIKSTPSPPIKSTPPLDEIKFSPDNPNNKASILQQLYDNVLSGDDKVYNDFILHTNVIKNYGIKITHINTFMKQLVKRYASTITIRGLKKYSIMKILLVKYDTEFKLQEILTYKDCDGSFNIETLKKMYTIVCNKTITAEYINDSKKKWCNRIIECQQK